MPKQALCAYCFGALHVLAQQHQLAPPEVHAIALALFSRHFGYSIQASAALAQTLINATGDPDPRNTHKAIMHRGIDAFLSWQNAREAFDAADFKNVIRALRSKQPVEEQVIAQAKHFLDLSLQHVEDGRVAWSDDQRTIFCLFTLGVVQGLAEPIHLSSKQVQAIYMRVIADLMEISDEDAISVAQFTHEMSADAELAKFLDQGMNAVAQWHGNPADPATHLLNTLL